MDADNTFTKREQIALQAMGLFISHSLEKRGVVNPNDAAISAYRIADAMLDWSGKDLPPMQPQRTATPEQSAEIKDALKPAI